MVRKLRSYSLRLPAELYEFAKEKADSAGETLGEEIARALVAYYKVQPEQERRIAELERIIEELLPRSPIVNSIDLVSTDNR